MKNKLTRIFVGFLVSGTLVMAQSHTKLAPQLQRLLGTLPAANPVVADLVLEKIVVSEDNVLALVDALFQAPNDTIVQYAIDGSAKFLSQHNGRARREFNKILADLTVKQAEQNESAARFLLRSLKRTAGESTLKKLRPLLQSRKLFDPAIAVFLSVGTPKAGKMLFEACKNADAYRKKHLIQSLADLHYQPAEKYLLRLMQNDFDQWQAVVLPALCELASADVLMQALAGVAPPTRQRFLLAAAERFSRQKLNSAAIETLGKIESGSLSPRLFIQFLQAKAKLQPAAANKICLEAVVKPDAKIAVAAVKIAQPIVTAAQVQSWISTFPRINSIAQPHAITLIAAKEKAGAVSFLKEILQQKKSFNRLAALRAFPKVDEENMVNILIDHLKTNPDKTDVDCIETIFAGQPADRFASQLFAGFVDMPDAGILAALHLFKQKRFTASLDDCTPLLNHRNGRVRIAALQWLRDFAAAEFVEECVVRAQSVKSKSEQREYFSSIRELAIRHKKLPQIVAASLQRLQQAEKLENQIFELNLLSGLGAVQAIESIFKLTNSGDDGLSEAAYRALFDWSRANVLETLLEIAGNTKNNTWHVLALRSIKRLIDAAELGPAAKVHYIQRALLACRTVADKRLLLGSLSQLQSEDALQIAMQYLQDDSLKVETGASMIQMAVPGNERDLEPRTAALLRTVLKNGIGRQAYAQIESGFIAQNEPPEGFVALFNGVDLSGWRGLAADPVQRQKMTAAEYALAQARADSSMRAHWRVENGQLLFDGKGQSLCTARNYQNYELRLDWKIQDDGDSGIYLRGAPQVQIWDPAFNRGIGSGGLYNNQIGPDKPLQLADRPIGEWNTFRITLVDDHCTVYLNDVLVVDDVVLENYWEREKQLYATGSIELQAHYHPLAFRNIFIRELPATVDTTIWDLFNGKDLSGWKVIGNEQNSWFVQDGILSTGGKGGGWISTEKEYADFQLTLEFKVPPGGNSGVFLRAPHIGDPAYTGMEIQVLDDYAEKYATLKPWQYTGSIYAVQAPGKRVTKPAGRWQKMAITCRGPKVEVVLNGSKIIDTNLIEHMDKTNRNPGLKRRHGFIGLQNHGAPVEYRNIRLREF